MTGRIGKIGKTILLKYLKI